VICITPRPLCTQSNVLLRVNNTVHAQAWKISVVTMLFGELVCLLLRSPLPLYKPTWYCFLYRRGVDPPGIRAGIPQGAAEARMAEMRGRRTTEEVGFWGGLVSLHPLGSLWSAVSSLSGVWGGHKHTLVHSERRKCARARRYREVMENPFP